MPVVTIQQAFELAVQHHQAGKLPEAERIYRQILAQEPEHAEAIHLLGVIAQQVGQSEAAVELIRRAIALKPGFAEAYSNLGAALRKLGRLEEAIAAYRQGAALNPKAPETHNNLGNALVDKGQAEQAVAAFRQAIALRPKYAQAYSNLGNALKVLGELDEAVGACRAAIALDPALAEAINNLGNALSASGQLDEAIAAYRQARALDSTAPETCNNFGNALRDKGQADEAAAAYRQAIALRPLYAEAHANLGNALKDLGQLDEGIAACRTAIAIKPDFSEAYNNLANVLTASGQVDEALAAYRQAISLKSNCAEVDSNFIFTLQFHPGYDGRQIDEEQRRWNQTHAGPWRNRAPAHSNDRDSSRRLRIGYVSPDFRDHVVGRNVLPLFRRHDRQQFQIFCYSQSPVADWMTREFQSHADGWRNTIGVADERVAAQIVEDRIDILVDLALHTAGNRLLVFARKPAPVQATFAGYPGSTGLTSIDYRLSDAYLDPLDAAHGKPFGGAHGMPPGMDESIYSEHTIRLPGSFWCYDPLDLADIQPSRLPAMEAGIVTFGCLNNFAKINDPVLSLWSQVLRSVKDSRLILLLSPCSQRQRTIERLSAHGIHPSRIEFASRLPRRSYLELYRQIDVGLDTFPYNGHTTSLDAFWMGVPVVTLLGQTAVSRAGWCQASNLGLAELAAHSPEQFVKIAVELAADLPRLQALRQTLRGKMQQSPLMDAPGFARNIEAAYRQMWRAWCETALTSG